MGLFWSDQPAAFITTYASRLRGTVRPVQAAIALPEIAALEIVPAGTATPAKVIPTLTALQEPVLAVAALVTAMDNAVVPVPRQ